MRILAMALCAVMLSGCVGYAPAGMWGMGFSETQLGPSVFRVAYKGDGYTSRETVNDYVLLRSAEVAHQHGFKYFVIYESRDTTTGGTMYMPGVSTTNATVTGYGNTASGAATTFTTPGYAMAFSYPGTTNTIFCFHENPNLPTINYEVAFLIRTLKRKHGIQ